MDHLKFKELAHLSVFGELNKTERILLEEHLSECAECREEMESLLKLKGILNKNRSVEVDDKLLTEARQDLRSALRRERSRQSFFNDILSGFVFKLRENYKLALGGLTTLIIGILLGYMFFSSPKPESLMANNLNDNSSENRDDENIRISNVRFIDQDASDGEVEFVFEAIKPMRVKGRVDDEQIKNILTYSMLNEENPGTRLNSISLINSENNKAVDNETKSAVLDVVKYDENAGVRREAFKLLTKFSYDEEIKQTYLYVLMNDSSASLRIDAMRALVEAGKEGHKFSPQDLTVFKEKMRTDENNYIRYYAKTVLQENQ
jgi:hypothetical protein